METNELKSNKKYNIIYADPPWTYEKSGGIKNSRGMAKQFYQTMSFDEIKKIKVKEISDDNCALLLWATYTKLPEALELIREWGFEYFGLGFNWVKKTKTGKDFFGMGHYTRANPEICLLAFKGKMKPLCHNIRALVYSERREHSRKPDEVRDKIVELFGDLPRIEMFAREKTEGWDVWGNETNKFIEKIYKENSSDSCMENKPETNEKAPAANSKKFHVVEKGDTLVAISKKHNVDVEKLRSLNKKVLENLKIGDKLALE